MRIMSCLHLITPLVYWNFSFFLGNNLCTNVTSSMLDTLYILACKKIIIETTSSGNSNLLRDMYSICRCCWNVATYKWNVHNVENWNHLFCRNFSFLTDPHGQFSSVCQNMKQTAWWACFSPDSRHSYWYQLCSLSLRHVPLRCRLHTRATQD
jgi:hypothetical protein